MPFERSPRRRKLLYACLAVPCLSVALYLGFVSVLSVWMGLHHMDRAGFWVPVLAGVSMLLVSLWLGLSLAWRLVRKEKEHGCVRISLEPPPS